MHNIIHKFRNFYCLINRGKMKYRLRYYDKRTKSRMSSDVKLSEKQLEQINDIWSKYIKLNNISHRFYLEKTGFFSPYYIPDSIHICYIDPYFNDWSRGKYIDNKCYYSKLFTGVCQPVMFFYRLNGFWFDEKDEFVAFSNVIDVLNSKNKPFFIKIANESLGGKGVWCVNPSNDDISKIINGISNDRDIVIQDSLIQSPILAMLNESSVNTIRLISLLQRDGEVKVLSGIMRIGRKGAKVDNASSGGITCGICDDGRLKSIAYTKYGEKYTEHPDTKIQFGNIMIPRYGDCINLVKQQHRRFPHFRLISWDLAIDLNNNVVLIEANLYDGEIDFHQLNNGPLFGKCTETILAEVFDR